MTLQEYLETLPADRKKLFIKKRSEYATTGSVFSQFCHNIDTESRVDSSTWQGIVAAVCDSADVSGAKVAITTACQSAPYCGGSIPAPLPSRYGRAINRNAFQEHVVRKKTRLARSTAIRIARQTVGKPVAEAQRLLGPIDLANYPMWATFHPDQRDTDPFTTLLPINATEIRRRLGLSLSTPREPLMLFVYELPASILPHYPTIANAYASPSWHPYFRPAPAGHPYGQTQPLDDPVGTDYPPCPEVIHEKVAVDALREPIRLAPP